MIPFWVMIVLFIVLALLEICFINVFHVRDSIFSFESNYNTWTKLSWVSVILLTLLIYIVLFPVLVLIIFVELFCMIFLRKEDK